jgi:hypothetical protein
VWPLVRNITANSKGGLEYVVDLSELCALVAHRKAEAVVCVTVSCDEARNDQNSLVRVITGDKKLVYCYKPETKQKSSHWKTPLSPYPKKARLVRSNTKSMLFILYLLGSFAISEGKTTKNI